MSDVVRDDETALAIDAVSFAYPRRPVLDAVSFRVPAGRFCVLLGVNGAGKTTLFSLITRLFVCRSGTIRIFGHDVHRQSRRALALLGVIFQQPTLDLDLSIRRNLEYHGALHGMAPALLRPRIERVLDALGLADRAGDAVRKLSGGQRRRVELARAVIHEPRLLLADEPTVGLDIHSRQTILEQVRAACRERGIGVLWATHLVDEVEPGDQVVVLHEGRVRFDGSAAELLRETGSERVQQAFNALTGGAA